MKKTRSSVLLILLLTISFAACKKSLPGKTQTGAGTFSCYLNGKLVTPRGGGIAPNRDCYYQQLAAGDSGYVFHVSGRDYKVPTNTKSVAINVAGMRIVEGMTIPLTKGIDYKSGRGQCSNGNTDLENKYYTTDAISGYLYFSKFDEVNQIAAGTFAFKAKNSFGDSVNITDGRFDMHFTR
jgi:hypothetical protein